MLLQLLLVAVAPQQPQCREDYRYQEHTSYHNAVDGRVDVRANKKKTTSKAKTPSAILPTNEHRNTTTTTAAAIDHPRIAPIGRPEAPSTASRSHGTATIVTVSAVAVVFVSETGGGGGDPGFVFG